MKERQPYKAFLEHDMKTIASLGKQAAFELAFATHAGLTEEEFMDAARAWFATAKHPKLGRPDRLVYQPQLELLEFLRANGFKTFIVSGGGVDFMRAFAEEVYGIPPEQVIGSSVKTRFEISDGGSDLMKLAELDSFDDREVKPPTSFCTSAAGRSSRSATRTATSRCCATRRPARARGSRS